jgi:hypothetical protein
MNSPWIRLNICSIAVLVPCGDTAVFCMLRPYRLGVTTAFK